tara:strand:+ start:111 stop:767 length:657 start_codon:yes stop_codon:yes gene_type:complete
MKTEFEKRLLTSLVLISLSIFLIIKGSYFFIFFLGIILLISIYEWSKMTKNLYQTKIFGIIFICLSIYSAYLFREKYSYHFFLFAISISVLTDLGGYFFGKLFKGPKLTKVSPNKTYSGVIGGFLLSMIGGILIIKLISYSSMIINDLIITLISIFLISLISQLGDLFISYFKRKSKIKDTGKILPGHGGLLDRIDGIIFAVPFSYLLFHYILSYLIK